MDFKRPPVLLEIFVTEATQSPRLARFDSFEVDLHTGELRRNGEKVKLPDQSFQILAMILANPGEVVMREEIQKRLWPNNTVVEFENSINAAVKNLRLALGDSADHPRYVETLPRRGYRFIAVVGYGACSNVSGAGSAGPQPSDVSLSGPGVVRVGSKSHPFALSGAIVGGKPNFLIGLVLGALALVALGIYTYTQTKPAPFQRIEITQVTGNGKVKTAAISPDGRYIAYVVDEGSGNPFFGLGAGGKESLWMRQAAMMSQ